jgi:hypothetical protein
MKARKEVRKNRPTYAALVAVDLDIARPQQPIMELQAQLAA